MNIKIIFVIFICLLIVYFVVEKNIIGNVKPNPQINQQIQIVTPTPETIQPTIIIQNQQVTQSVANDSCRDGNTIRQKVSSCNSGLSCGPFTPISERYCRLSDGTCKFFCSDK